VQRFREFRQQLLLLFGRFSYPTLTASSASCVLFSLSVAAYLIQILSLCSKKMIFLYRFSTLLDFHAVWKLFMITGVNRETNEPVLMMMMGAALPCKKALLSYRVSILLQYKNLSVSLLIIAAQHEKKKQQLQVARFYTLKKLCTTLGRLPVHMRDISSCYVSFLLNTSTEFLLFSSVSEVVWTCAFRTFWTCAFFCTFLGICSGHAPFAGRSWLAVPQHYQSDHTVVLRAPVGNWRAFRVFSWSAYLLRHGMIIGSA